MKRKLVTSVFIIIAILIVDGIVNHFYIATTTYELKPNKISQDYTFAQISDYHSNSNQSQKILDVTATSNPDYILLSGDILESADITPTIDFITNLQAIAPVIYARGNHDDDYQSYTEFTEKLDEMGVIVLNSENYETEDLNFIGIEDFSGANLFEKTEFTQIYNDYIAGYQSLVEDSKYNILLGHRPNYLEAYSKLGVDLVVSGHAHGGQWQLPFTDIGLIAPDEGLFPTHVHGLDTQGTTTQIISSGTSNPYGPFIPRLFNPEEVVVIELKQE